MTQGMCTYAYIQICIQCNSDTGHGHTQGTYKYMYIYVYRVTVTQDTRALRQPRPGISFRRCVPHTHTHTHTHVCMHTYIKKCTRTLAYTQNATVCYKNVLSCVAVCYSVLQSVAECCIVCCSVLQCVVEC